MTNSRWQIPVVAVLGAWLIISPWIVGTGWTTPLAWDASASGLAVMFLAAWVLGSAHGVLPNAARAPGDMRANRPGGAVPDESGHMAGVSAHGPGGPDIEAPDFHVQAPGETTKG